MKIRDRREIVRTRIIEILYLLAVPLSQNIGWQELFSLFKIGKSSFLTVVRVFATAENNLSIH